VSSWQGLVEPRLGMSKRAKSLVLSPSGAMTAALTATGDLFTREEARILGLRDADLRRLVREKYLVNLRRGIYIRADDLAVIASDDARRHALEVRALLRALSRQRIAAAGTSAARIHGLEFLDPPDRRLVVVTDDPGVTGTARDGYALRVAPLPAGHLCDRFGAPLTSPSRTLIDLTAEMGFVAGVVVAESAVRRRLVTQAELGTALDAAAGRPGIQAARAALGFVDPAAESPLESASRAVIHQLGLPPPRTQVVLDDGARPFIRVDFGWDGVDVVGESDGLDKYVDLGRIETVRAIKEEKARERRILALGYEIARWGWDEVRDPRLLNAILTDAFRRGLERRRGRRR
jgi:hypothetical protein